MQWLAISFLQLQNKFKCLFFLWLEKSYGVDICVAKIAYSMAKMHLFWLCWTKNSTYWLKYQVLGLHNCDLVLQFVVSHPQTILGLTVQPQWTVYLIRRMSEIASSIVVRFILFMQIMYYSISGPHGKPEWMNSCSSKIKSQNCSFNGTPKNYWNIFNKTHVA